MILRNKISFLLEIILLFSLIQVNFNNLAAQPSGGPYGPVRHTYELPKNARIFYVSPDGKPDQSGESITNPSTIESVIERVQTGDAIILRGGTYRTGNLIFNQGILIQPYNGEKPVLKGTFVADKWEDLKNGLWTTKWSKLFPQKPQDWWRRNREGKSTPLHKFNNDMVFVNGKFLQSVGWEGDVDENSYYIDYETGTVYIGTDPKDKLIEITAFDAGLIRTTRDVHGKRSDKKGPAIKGITITQYAYRAIEIEGTEPEGISDEKNHGKEVVGTLLEDCTITFCSRVAGYFRGDNLVIRNCKVSDTSTEGIYIIASNDVLLEKNIITRNNIEDITGYYPALVKIFNQSYRVTCRDNLVIDSPNSNGIWYDVGNVDGVFINNWVERVGNNNSDVNTSNIFPANNGFFFEISKSAICAGNVFVNCDRGLMVLNASDVHMYNNTFVNSTVCIARTARSAQGDHFGWHPATGPDVDERDGHIFVNNLLTGDEAFYRPLMFVWQPPALCEKLTQPQFQQYDFNVYVRGIEKAQNPLILWSPAAVDNCQNEFESLERFQNSYPAFEKNSKLFNSYDGPLFKGEELGIYNVLPGFQAIKSGTQPPSEIRKLLNMKGNYIGAFSLTEDK